MLVSCQDNQWLYKMCVNLEIQGSVVDALVSGGINPRAVSNTNVQVLL